MSLKLKQLVLVLVCYLLLLAGNTPAGVVRVFMPADIKAGRFSGSLWQGRVYQLTWRNVTIEDVHWQLTFSSWRPAIKVALRDPRGLQGTGTLRGWHDLEWYEWQLSAPADFVRQQLSLALAMTLKGGLQLQLHQGEFTSHGCQRLGGVIKWRHAQMATPLGDLDLTDVDGELSCNGKGELALVLKQDSPHLNIEGRGVVGAGGGYRFNGLVRSGPMLPEAMKPLLAQVGRANERGQIAWQTQGQLF